MKTLKIPELLDFAIPNEMRKLTEEETSSYFPVANEETCAFRNEEKHTIIAIICKKRPFLLGRTASLDASLKATEKNIQKRIATYENVGYGRKTADGKEFLTFDFEYTVQGTRQRGKYGLCCLGNYFLAFESICGKDYVDFADRKYDELLSSVRFK